MGSFDLIVNSLFYLWSRACFLVMYCCRFLQVYVALLVKHHFRNHCVELVKRMPEPLFEFHGDEVRLVRPSFQTLGNQVVCKAFKLLVWVLHLIILSVKDDTLLNLVLVWSRNLVVANTQFFNAEVSLQCVSDWNTALRLDGAVEYLEIHEWHVVGYQWRYCDCAFVSKVAVSELELL